MGTPPPDADSIARLQAAVTAIESVRHDSADEQVPLSEAAHAAVKAALRLLSSRQRSRHEIVSRLSAKDFDTATIDEALRRLESWNLIDDAAFAQAWVHQRSRLQGAARNRLRRELADKGVAAADADAALEQVTSEDERATATALITARLHRYRGDDLNDRATKDAVTRRLVGFLQRRGYALSLALEVVTAEIAAAAEFH